jgi:hypothetical protein
VFITVYYGSIVNRLSDLLELTVRLRYGILKTTGIWKGYVCYFTLCYARQFSEHRGL